MAAQRTERFTDDEADALRPYFTSVDGPSFAVVNLPEMVKSALFARYAKTSLGMRRLFLKEFVGELDTTADRPLDAGAGLAPTDAHYDRVFHDYGDDSVAELGVVHFVCEQSSTLLTQSLLGDLRSTSVEQSSREVAFDERLDGRYRYYRDPDVLGSKSGTRYISEMDRLFELYSDLIPAMVEFFRAHVPKDDTTSDLAHKEAIRAHALNAARGVLPVGALNRIGVVGSARDFETALNRLQVNPLPEAQACAQEILEQLRKVLPTLLQRVDDPDRGGRSVDYLRETDRATSEIAAQVLPTIDLSYDQGGDVTLVDFDPDAEVKLVSAMLYRATSHPDRVLEERARDMSVEQRLAIMRAYVGDRPSRRQVPGDALERVTYRFDVVADNATLRDLQRDHAFTIESQNLDPGLGFEMPDSIHAAGLTELFEDAMARSSDLFDLLEPELPAQARYALAGAHRQRFAVQVTAGGAMRVLELRTTAPGEGNDRRITAQMHRQIAETAGHHAVAAMMGFVDHTAPKWDESVLAAAAEPPSRSGADGTPGSPSPQ